MDSRSEEGAIASYTGVYGEGDLASAIAAGRYLAANLAGDSSVNAVIELLASIIAQLDGSGDLTGNLFAALAAAAALNGSGDLSGSIEAIAYILSQLDGDSTLNLTIESKGVIAATITTVTELSPQNLSEAVWSYLKTNPTIAGSMKEELHKAKTAAENAFAVSS